jgi:DNA polymerase-4/DNA polymerase V
MCRGAGAFITLHSYPRAIVHVDCDAFFTSCEQVRDPKLRARPVVTGKERGIISCASYEAKALGIKRGISLLEAKKMCPELIVLPSDYETYSIYSERMFTILKRFTPTVEEYSIDEAFCDLTGLRRLYHGSYPKIALLMKAAVQKELGITVSIGLSISKTLAKICSKENKPDGFTAVPGTRLHGFLAKIPLERVCGFGPNTVALLEKHGLNTVLDYVERPLSFADALLGKTGRELWQELRGIPVYMVSTEKKDRYLTISKTKTFLPHSGSRDIVKAQLVRNLESALIKLRRHGLAARSVTAFLKRIDYSGSAAEGKINRHSSSTMDFTRLCSDLFDNIFEPGSVYRATGIVLSDIAAERSCEKDLFDDPVKVKQVRRISEATDAINAAFGKHTVHLASSDAAGRRKEHPRNSLTWRKHDLLKGETFRKRIGIPLIKLS